MSKSVKDHLAELLQHQTTAQEGIAIHLSQYQQKMRKYHDQHASSRTVQLGDSGYIYVPKLTTPRTRKSYHGLYVVVRMTTDVTALLKRPSDNKVLQKSVNVAQLKIGHIRQRVELLSPLYPDDTIVDDPEELLEDDADRFQFLS